MAYLHAVLTAASFAAAPPAPGVPFIAAPFAAVTFDPAKSPNAGGWREKVYNRPVAWEAVGGEGGAVLHAESDGSASMLYRDLAFDANAEPLVSWRWRVVRLPSKGAENDRAHDDYGARVYFFFPGWTFLTSYVLEYVWDNEAPPGTIKTSPSSGRCRLVVANSGTADLGKWVTVERNLRDDFARAFGRPPDRNVGGIGFMTDSDNTRSRAEAYYGPVTIGR